MKTEVKTFKYSELKNLIKEHNLLPFNREISETHINSIKDSVINSGILRFPLIGRLKFENDSYAIVDGQHLISAIVSLPKELRVSQQVCIVKEYETKKDVIYDISKLNNTQKTWRDENFLDAWYKFGDDQNEDYFTNYVRLHKKYNQGDLPCGLLVDIYSKNKDSFREGRLTFFDKYFSDEIYSLCNYLRSEFDSASFMLHGLKNFAFERHSAKKEINWIKLKSRLSDSMRSKGYENSKKKPSRDDFKNFVEEVYSKL